MMHWQGLTDISLAVAANGAAAFSGILSFMVVAPSGRSGRCSARARIPSRVRASVPPHANGPPRPARDQEGTPRPRSSSSTSPRASRSASPRRRSPRRCAARASARRRSAPSSARSTCRGRSSGSAGPFVDTFSSDRFGRRRDLDLADADRHDGRRSSSRCRVDFVDRARPLHARSSSCTTRSARRRTSPSTRSPSACCPRTSAAWPTASCSRAPRSARRSAARACCSSPRSCRSGSTYFFVAGAILLITLFVVLPLARSRRSAAARTRAGARVATIGGELEALRARGVERVHRLARGAGRRDRRAAADRRLCAEPRAAVEPRRRARPRRQRSRAAQPRRRR